MILCVVMGRAVAVETIAVTAVDNAFLVVLVEAVVAVTGTFALIAGAACCESDWLTADDAATFVVTMEVPGVNLWIGCTNPVAFGGCGC